MKELLRFTSRGTNGMNILYPPKVDFVFYESKLEMYKKGKLIRTVNYEGIIKISILKAFQSNIFITCLPMQIIIHNVSDDIYDKIKKITKK